MKFFRPNQSGFTVIELVVIIIILCVLGTLVALAYSGVQASNRDKQRQADIETLQSQLELYYAVNDKYPSLAEINNPTWRAEHLKNLTDDTLRDPQWIARGECSLENKPTLSSGKNCYTYEVTAADGTICDNITISCTHYTLAATLEDNQAFVKASLN